MVRGRPWWKSILLNALALVCGVFVAVVTVTAYVWADDALNASVDFLSPAEAARAAVFFSAKAALQVLIVCVPLWLVLDRLGWANRIIAAAIGFIAPLAWLWFNAWTLGYDKPLLELASAWPVAMCGAFAGLAAWWTRPRAASSV
jgi:hypothetical protein